MAAHRHHILALLALTLIAAVATSPARAVPTCPISYGTKDDAKPNKLYLYFPAVDDPGFPGFGFVPAFNVANLTSYAGTGGTATALQDGVFDVVADDYCEFNVQVRQTTTFPPTTFAHRNIVAIGTDANGGLFGQAQAVDTGDVTDVDYSREWTGTYQTQYGGAGGALNGTNATLERWARAIGGSAAHEAGHNYGLAHSDDATAASGEDAPTRHIMPAGPTLNGEQRAGYRRHFSDATFSILAANVGLSIQTMHNWNLVNPNATSGRQLRVTFLSPDTSVILSWVYSGAPWANPTVSGSGTQVFKGTTYNRFEMTWSTPQPWGGGPPGEVPAGAVFHIGALFSGVDFNQPDPIIITGLSLLNAGGNPLPLQPRLPGYDAGTLDFADNTFGINFFNVQAQPLLLENVVVRQLPRVLSLNAMVGSGKKLFDWTGQPFRPWPNTERTVLKRSKPLKKGETLRIRIASLSQKHHVLKRIDANCDGSDNVTGAPDVKGCIPGVSTDLFPATTVYLTAIVVQPKVKHWDRRLKKMVVGDVREPIFIQVGGRSQLKGGTRSNAYGALDPDVAKMFAPWASYDSRNQREFVAASVGGYRFQPANATSGLNTFFPR